MTIICGKHGEFCGRQETVFKAKEQIRYAIKMCEGEKTRTKFITQLKENEEEKNMYLNSFDLIYMLNDFNEDEKKCYDLLIEEFS